MAAAGSRQCEASIGHETSVFVDARTPPIERKVGDRLRKGAAIRRSAAFCLESLMKMLAFVLPTLCQNASTMRRVRSAAYWRHHAGIRGSANVEIREGGSRRSVWSVMQARRRTWLNRYIWKWKLSFSGNNRMDNLVRVRNGRRCEYRRP